MCKGDLGSSLRDNRTVGKERRIVLQKKLNRQVCEEIVRHRYASQIGKEGKTDGEEKKEGN